MEKIRKQTVSRIAEFFNGESTNAEVDTYKKLLDFEQEVKKQFALQGVGCSNLINTKHDFVEIIKDIRRADKNNEDNLYDNTLVLAQNLIIKYKIIKR